MVEGHLNHPKICIASRCQKRTFEGTGITFKIISFLNLTLQNMPAVANVGFRHNWQGFIYLIQIIHWFKIQIGLLNGSPSKVGMLVTIEIFFAYSTVVWPKRNSTSTVTQIYLIQLRRYNFQKCGFNYFRNQMWKQILLRCWFAVCVNKSFSW